LKTCLEKLKISQDVIIEATIFKKSIVGHSYVVPESQPMFNLLSYKMHKVCINYVFASKIIALGYQPFIDPNPYCPSEINHMLPDADKLEFAHLCAIAMYRFICICNSDDHDYPNLAKSSLGPGFPLDAASAAFWAIHSNDRWKFM